jgi:hypothetical protein
MRAHDVRKKRTRTSSCDQEGCPHVAAVSRATVRLHQHRLGEVLKSGTVRESGRHRKPQRSSSQQKIWNFHVRLHTRERTKREGMKNFVGAEEDTPHLQAGMLMPDTDQRHRSYRAGCSRSLSTPRSSVYPSDVPTRRTQTMMLRDDPRLPCQASDLGVHNPLFS